MVLYDTLSGEPVGNEITVIRGAIIRLEAFSVIGDYTRKTISGIYTVLRITIQNISTVARIRTGG